jgi:dihydrofolate reductase
MYKDKRVIHIVACQEDGGIGINNDLLYHIKEDLKFFREQTLGHALLMGRKTVESLPKPLDRRVVFCISSEISNRSEKFSYKSMSLESSLNVGYWQSNQLKTDKIFVCGGGQLYQSTFDITDELWITQIKGDKEADTFYHIPDNFEMFQCGNWLESKNPYGEVTLYRFTKWKRK